MTTQHPITPPPELVRQWSQNRGYSCADELWDYLATQAAQWGANQELEACLEHLFRRGFSDADILCLRAARRPKPPSLKEQALHELNDVYNRDKIDDSTYDTIRRALGALDD